MRLIKTLATITLFSVFSQSAFANDETAGAPDAPRRNTEDAYYRGRPNDEVFKKGSERDSSDRDASYTDRTYNAKKSAKNSTSKMENQSKKDTRSLEEQKDTESQMNKKPNEQ
jgi:hypothetical protein